MKPASSTLFVRMPTDLHAAIKRAAASEDRTVSQFIRQTMREELAARATQEGQDGE